MQIILLVTKEDIQTQKIGFHYQIKTKEGVTINFSPDALDELFNDVEEWKRQESKEIINEPGN